MYVLGSMVQCSPMIAMPLMDDLTQKVEARDPLL